MATEKRRIQLTFHDDRPLRVLGLDPDGAGSTQVWAALDHYAALVEGAGRELERRLSRAEWNLIADTLNGCVDVTWDLGEPRVPALALIAADVEDSHRLDGAGDKWFGEGKGDAGVQKLLNKLRDLNPLHGDAILVAVRHFWDHPEVDAAEDRWWTVAARAGAAAGKEG